MPWVLRGLRNGIVTTRYPRRPDGYGRTYRGAIDVVPSPASTNGSTRHQDVERLCPTGAIGVAGGNVRVDRGRCILCGRCVAERPELFTFSPEINVAALERGALVVPNRDDDLDDETVERSRMELGRRVRALRRSVHVRHVDAGSDGAEEWEIAALTNPVYDIQRLGVFFTASPRHADLLLVTGAGTAGMVGPLRRTWEAMPAPKIVIAAGTDAISGGLMHPTYATRGGVGQILPVDVWVPGSPPSPFSLLNAILIGVGLLTPRRSA
jgi:Ni,Fe-hydrogenase III small subunit/ferredoxin